MKKILPILSFGFLVLFSANAQTDVTLAINHLLADEPFLMNHGALNNIGHDFNITRLEYYISEVTLVHDGGMETVIEDTWILVNASDREEVFLGNLDISTLESVRFGIGVDPDHNHLDPAEFESDHPLAPKFPSMHWGWSAGYRFVALEGNGGPNYNQTIELHGLGDYNYFEVEIDANLSEQEGELLIELDADYTMALEDIELNSGVIVHGEGGAAKKALENFRDYVFSVSTFAVSVDGLDKIESFEVFPNPSTSGLFNISSNIENIGNYSVRIADVIGRDILNINTLSDQSTQVQLDRSGIYLVQLIKDGETMRTTKLIVE